MLGQFKGFLREEFPILLDETNRGNKVTKAPYVKKLNDNPLKYVEKSLIDFE